VWTVENEAGRAVLYAGFAFGWALVLLATVVINHFDLFGLRQSWHGFQGRPQTPLHFVTPFLYRMVRHPLYVGWLFTFWSTPTMTVTHLLFAVVASAYILVAIQFEERDLMRDHPEYAEYRRRVPMLVPAWPKDVPVHETAHTARTSSHDDADALRRVGLVRRRVRRRGRAASRVADDGVRHRSSVVLLAQFAAVRVVAARESPARSVPASGDAR
jgi:protein-S-isoprenylcysteine O-methyltransferase Ste14